MKITLKNFRCYDNNSFDFGNRGIVLLSGSSGVGKTTILLGIYFALFGTGSKLISYGKASCKVTLEFDDLTVVRTKRPNRLVVNDVYEDQAGQSIINKKFGDSFKTTGYISQNARDSFIMLSPIEKLAFLEKFAFQDIDLSQIKKRCKDLIKERNETLLKTASQLEMASLMLKELPEPVEVKFPLEGSVKNRSRIIKNETVRLKNTIILIKRCKKKLAFFNKELESLRVLEARRQTKQDSIDLITKKLTKLSLEEKTIDYQGDKKIEEYEKQLSIVVSQRELVSLRKRYNEDVKRLEAMQEEEFRTLTEQINNINSKMWKEYSKDELTSTISEYKQIIKDIEKINELQEDLGRYEVDEEQLKKHIDDLKEYRETLDKKKKLLSKLEMQQEVYSCPSCSIPLRFHDNELEIYDSPDSDLEESDDIDAITKQVQKIKRKVSNLESIIPSKKHKLKKYEELSKKINDIRDQYEELPDIKEMRNDLEYIRNYRSSQKELERNRDKLHSLLKEKKYSSTLVSFQKSIQRQKKIIDGLEHDNTTICGIDEEKLRDSITIQKRNKEKLAAVSDNIKNLEKELSSHRSQLHMHESKHTHKYKKVRTICRVESKLKKTMDELTKLEEQKVLHEKNVKDIEKFERYIDEKSKYESWKQKVDVLHQEEIENKHQYAAAMLLKEKILEAESIAMLNVISSINTHAQPYLDEFFPDNPISVKLITFKESKKKRKPQINLQIEYKGMEADIGMLSGGELSRVILAFALALGEMFNTPIMLLDECTASLDQELTGSVMDGIRENYTGKLVLVIAHQTVEGSYDKVIKLV